MNDTCFHSIHFSFPIYKGYVTQVVQDKLFESQILGLKTLKKYDLMKMICFIGIFLDQNIVEIWSAFVIEVILGEVLTLEFESSISLHWLATHFALHVVYLFDLLYVFFFFFGWFEGWSDLQVAYPG